MGLQSFILKFKAHNLLVTFVGDVLMRGFGIPEIDILLIKTQPGMQKCLYCLNPKYEWSYHLRPLWTKGLSFKLGNGVISGLMFH